jgi:transaldolase
MTDNSSLLTSLRVAVFVDGADLDALRRLAADPLIRGFTTNPTLMRKAGITDYEAFARSAAEIAGERPISFEVFSDEFDEMERQAEVIAGWGENVFVKVPVTDTRGTSSDDVVRRLSARGIKINVTALATVAQVERVAGWLEPGVPSFVSLFAGRIADTGRDPVPFIRQSVEVLESMPTAKLIWASPREVLNIFQANDVGCDVITATTDILAKLHFVGKDLDAFSLETVQMFHADAAAAGYQIETTPSVMVAAGGDE